MTRRLTGRPARFTAAAAFAIAGLVAFATLAGVGLSQIGSSAQQYGEYQYGQHVVICHHTHSTKHPFATITVGKAAGQAHLKKHHGDHLGACTAAELAPPKHTGKPDSPGNGHSQGQGNGQGQGQGQGHGNGHGKGHG